MTHESFDAAGNPVHPTEAAQPTAGAHDVSTPATQPAPATDATPTVSYGAETLAAPRVDADAAPATSAATPAAATPAPAAPVAPAAHTAPVAPDAPTAPATQAAPAAHTAPAAAAPAAHGAHGSAPYPAPPLPGAANGTYAAAPAGSPYDAYVGSGAGTPPTGPGSGNAFSSPAKKPRRGMTLLVSGLVVGALLGGGAGAGVALMVSPSGTALSSTANAGSGTIAINDTSNVNNTTAVAAKVLPSVVMISVSSGESGGTGSGVILSKDGYILTNTHVVTLDGAVSNPTIQVKDNNGRLYSAKIVGTDPTYDLAVIKVEGVTDLTPIAIADSADLNVGQAAIAVGAPYGLSGTVTDGIISALNRSITVASSAAPEGGSQQNDESTTPENPYGFDLGQGQQSTTKSTISLAVIQTDAAINPGNSGGALVNSKGELIGINVAIKTTGSTSSSSADSGNIGIGFSIPSNIAKRVADEIIADGKASHGLLGATVTDSASVSGSTVMGAYLKEVSSGGAAASAGLKAGDIITAVGDAPVGEANDLTAQVRALAAGAKTQITYVRDGKAATVDVTLGSLS